MYLSLEVRIVFSPAGTTAAGVSDAEGYTYSAVWLAFGVGLLVVGIFLRSQPVRLCSAAVVLLTVGKVFLLDMAGPARGGGRFSFLGLGRVLGGIGVLYHRVPFRQPP